MKQKVLWLSRHPLDSNQLSDLETWFEKPIDVETRNILWQASGNAKADNEANAKIWRDLVSECDEHDVTICGVFPPVAIEALAFGDRPFMDASNEKTISLLSPVSKQDRSIRQDGEAQIKFVHLRWAQVIWDKWFWG